MCLLLCGLLTPPLLLLQHVEGWLLFRPLVKRLLRVSRFSFSLAMAAGVTGLAAVVAPVDVVVVYDAAAAAASVSVHH